MSKSVIDRLYNSMINDLDYKDLPETERARNQLRSCVMGHSEVACVNEYQGFVYDFRYAIGLFTGGRDIYSKD